MPQTYSILIASFVGLGHPLVHTFSTSYKYVVRCIDFYAGNSTPAPVCHVQGNLGQTFAYCVGDSIQNTHQQWTGRQVFPPGSTLTFSVTSGLFDITCTGYQLTLP